MSSLAKERSRSALGWSVLGIAAWIGAELIVGLGFGIVYAIGIEGWGWPDKEPAVVLLLLYALAIAAAKGGFTLVRRILSSLPNSKEFSLPPSPPRF